jgi:hypothetical protein
LVAVEIGLAERPSVCEIHLIEGIANLEEFVKGVLEAFVNVSSSVRVVSND